MRGSVSGGGSRLRQVAGIRQVPEAGGRRGGRAMGSKIVRAQFPGICVACKLAIRPGNHIWMFSRNTGWQHQACRSQPDKTPDYHPQTFSQTVNLVMAKIRQLGQDSQD